MTDLGWLDALEARQRKHGGVTAADVARLTSALRRVEKLIDRQEDDPYVHAHPGFPLCGEPDCAACWVADIAAALASP